MDFLILIIAIIIVIYRKHKGKILITMKRITLKTLAITLSLIVVVSLVVSKLAQKLLDSIGEEMKKMGVNNKSQMAGGSICSSARKTKM